MSEQRVAWELHVELATRIAVVPLPAEGGLLTEALDSLAEMADRCRGILRDHHPEPDPDSVNFRVESVAREILVEVVDPFVARWRPELASWMAVRQPRTGQQDHEQAWPRAARLRAELAELSVRLRPKVDQLAELAGATSLLSMVGE